MATERSESVASSLSFSLVWAERDPCLGSRLALNARRTNPRGPPLVENRFTKVEQLWLRLGGAGLEPAKP